MDFKSTFLKLTDHTIPYEYEYLLEQLLPNGTKKDKFGNYFVKIGNSRTLFTSHLDTYSQDYEKVNHVIEGNIIKTDGSTILGGDNKAGVCVLFYMIENNIPGTYFFFIGEEPILSGGLYGSSLVAQNKEFSKNFDRAIAFDRKHYGSIITRQSARICCSDEFANALIEEFSSNGIPMKKDPTGYYTDTASFMDDVSEITNISVGVWNEHHTNEYVDISYVERIANAAIKINWEKLPTVREIGTWIKDEKDPIEKKRLKKYSNFSNSQKDRKTFIEIHKLLTEIDDYVLMNTGQFKPGKEMWYNKWFEEDPL